LFWMAGWSILNGWPRWLDWLPGLPGVSYFDGRLASLSGMAGKAGCSAWLACLACLAGWNGLPLLAGLYRNSYVATHMARVQLRERYQAKFCHKLEMLKAYQGWQQLDLNKQVKCRRLLLRLGRAGLIWAGLY
jgi:hypothetical protein